MERVAPAGGPEGGTVAAPEGSRSVVGQVAFTRLWLPVAILGVVLLFELVLEPRFPPEPWLWVRLAFYGLLGPVVTFVTLTWITRQVRARERAQVQLAATYQELQRSHAMLSAINRVTERFAAATDLEAAVRAAAVGAREVTGARAAAVVLGAGSRELADHEGLDERLVPVVRARDAALRAGGEPEDAIDTALGPRWVLSAPLRLGEAVGGSLHAVFVEPPGARARESFAILAAEFATVAEAANSRMRDLLTLFDVDRSIRAEGNLERLLEALLSRTMQRVGASRGAVYLTDGGLVLEPQVVRGAEGAAPLRVGESRLGGLAREGSAVLLQDPPPELREDAGAFLADGVGCLVALPLTADDELLGLLLLVHPEPTAITEAQLPFLSLVASQVSLALRNARAYLHSEELAIGEERARIAREIHDGVAQSLAFSALKIDLGRRLLEKDPARAEEELALAGGTVRESIREVRRSIFALRPVDLERFGLVETLRRYAIDFGQQNAVRVDFELGELPELEVRSEAVLFRIFQEAMHNVAKHAKARTVRVELGADAQGRPYVEVRDDGRGFDPQAVGDRVTSAGGLGLRQMRERVAARGGVFMVESRPGEGTRVRAALP